MLSLIALYRTHHQLPAGLDFFQTRPADCYQHCSYCTHSLYQLLYSCCLYCLSQVFERLLSEWCPAGSCELVPGFKAYIVQQLGGQACVLGLLGNVTAAGGAGNGLTAAAAASQAGPLDVRDAATITLLSEVSSALKLLHERCGDELSVHLCNQVLPASGLPVELQQQLVRHVRESDARQLKDFLRELLLSARAGQQQK